MGDEDNGAADPIAPDLDVKEKNLHQADSLSLLLFTFLLTLTVLTIWLFKHRRLRFLHETGLALLFGLIMGAIVRYGVSDLGTAPKIMKVKPMNMVEAVNATVRLPDILLLEAKGGKGSESLLNKTLAYSFKGEVKDIDNINQIDQKTTFDPEIFFNIILPPIIFNAGYSMKKRFFFRNIGSILTLAFVGTTISTFVVGGIMFGFMQIFPHLSFFTWLDCLRFGALISATDPVTCLAIFNDLHVDVNLYALVFGESVLNDAVAIVITRTLEDYEESYAGKDVPLPAHLIFFKSIGEFIGVFGASFLVGSILGCATALITKFTHIRNFPTLESTLFILMSYSTFLIAEVLGLTGIVAVLFCGICQAHYTYNNLSPEARSGTKQFFGLLNFMAENFIFSYIGVSIFTFPKHNFDPGFIFAAFVSIIIGRALNVYPLSFILNLGRKHKISYNLQHMLFLTGLRGAIAFALSIRNTLTAARQVILTATLVIVLVTVIVGGGSTVTLLTWLGIPLGLNEDADDRHQLDNGGEQTPLTPNTTPKRYRTSMLSSEVGTPATSPIPQDNQQEDNVVAGDKSLLAKYWSGFDKHFMKPLLTHSNPTLMETMPHCCLPLARALTSTEQLMRHPAMMSSGDISHAQEVGNVGDVISGGPEPVLPVTAQTLKSPTGASSSPFQFVDSPTREKFDVSKGLPSHM